MAEGKKYVVGIDGGGTKTHALLVASDGTVISEQHGGPSNLQVIGAENSAKVLFDLILECCKQGECSADSLQSVVVGIAGAGRISERTALVDALIHIGNRRKFTLKNIIVETDARIALEAAFAGGPGIVLLAGTGSIGLYRTEDGNFLRAGGWGNILGDEGSGYNLAKDALNAVMRAHDGRSEKTLLTAKAIQHFGIEQIEGLISKIYQDHEDVASFAPKVIEAYEERDRVAHGVLIKNSNELVEIVRILTMKARPRKKLTVCLMGGILVPENVYSKMVRDKIVHSLPQVVVQKPKFPAAFGAAILGLNAFR